MADTIPTQSITLDGARKVLDGALDKAADLGLRFCITVPDPSGEPVMSARMDGAPRLSAGIAANKAFTEAGFGGMPTDAWWGFIKDEPALVHGITNTPPPHRVRRWRPDHIERRARGHHRRVRPIGRGGHDRRLRRCGRPRLTPPTELQGADPLLGDPRLVVRS